MNTKSTETPPICSYEGSDYQRTFWDSGERRYEDAVEQIALKRLLSEPGKLLLELGAGAGRNTPRYSGFERVVLLDYSRSDWTPAICSLPRISISSHSSTDCLTAPP